MKALVKFKNPSKALIIGYSIGRVASTALITFVTLSSYFYYLEYVGIDPFLNGVAHSASRFFMALSSIVVGYISDILIPKRLGKRKIFIVIGSSLLGLSFAMIFNPFVKSISGSELLLFFYEAIWLVLFGVSYSMLVVPYLALIPEFSKPKERPVISFYQNVFNIVGNILGIGASLVLPFLFTGNYLLFYYFLLFLAILTPILYVPTLILVKVENKPLREINPLREVKIILNDRNFWRWEVAKGFISSGVIIFTAMIIDFVVGYIGVIEFSYLFELLFFVLIAFALIFMIMRVSESAGIKKTIIYSISLMSVSFFFLTFSSWIENSLLKIRYSLFFLLLFIVGLLGYWVFNYAVTANIIDMNTRLTGESRAGTYMGVDNITANLFQALGYLALGFALKYLYWFSETSWFLIAGLFIVFSLIPIRGVVPEINNGEGRR